MASPCESPSPVAAQPASPPRPPEDPPEDSPQVLQLKKEKKDLQDRLEFVEELVGPTEAQRKVLHEQSIAARAAAIRAKYRGANVPTKVTGRLDERLLWYYGLSERDAGLLQGGCLPDKEGILQDVSLLGDPSFTPYDQQSGEPRWHARGGLLQLSLGEVRTRFGDDIANDVVRCAKELDTYDGSRRVGVELPWHPLEDRELHAAEVIDLMDRELSMQTSLLHLEKRDALHYGDHDGAYVSPYAVAASAPRRGRRRRGGRLPAVAPPRCRPGAAVVALPRVEPAVSSRRSLTACVPSSAARPFDHPLGCSDRGDGGRFF